MEIKNGCCGTVVGPDDLLHTQPSQPSSTDQEDALTYREYTDWPDSCMAITILTFGVVKLDPNCGDTIQVDLGHLVETYTSTGQSDPEGDGENEDKPPPMDESLLSKYC